ncbi:MAG: HIRAN domain-containing protein [SAR324 cluster bacterium]|nr:HIRAN domain-containing protein [SAR324 cluster bacterium]
MNDGQLHFLGIIYSKIVGIQYYEAEVDEDETIHFERNPKNEFDFNAIEVHNSQFEAVGHVPKNYSVFLAPLIDQRKVFLKGKVEDEGNDWDVPIEIQVHLTKKGIVILDQGDEDNVRQIKHNMVAAFYNKAEQ